MSNALRTKFNLVAYLSLFQSEYKLDVCCASVSIDCLLLILISTLKCKYLISCLKYIKDYMVFCLDEFSSEIKI